MPRWGKERSSTRQPSSLRIEAAADDQDLLGEIVGLAPEGGGVGTG
jgi:hypothetical protein